MAGRVMDGSSLSKPQGLGDYMGSMDMDMKMLDASFSGGCDNVDNSGSLGSYAFFDAGKLTASSDGSPSESPSVCGSQEIAVSGNSHLPPKGRKRSKSQVDLSEFKRERQAAKNRETARAFRSKMDNLRSYSESRVEELTQWTKGLAILIMKQKLQRSSMS